MRGYQNVGGGAKAFSPEGSPSSRVFMVMTPLKAVKRKWFVSEHWIMEGWQTVALLMSRSQRGGLRSISNTTDEAKTYALDLLTRSEKAREIVIACAESYPELEEAKSIALAIRTRDQAQAMMREMLT